MLEICDPLLVKVDVGTLKATDQNVESIRRAIARLEDGFQTMALNTMLGRAPGEFSAEQRLPVLQAIKTLRDVIDAMKW